MARRAEIRRLTTYFNCTNWLCLDKRKWPTFKYHPIYIEQVHLILRVVKVAQYLLQAVQTEGASYYNNLPMTDQNYETGSVLARSFHILPIEWSQSVFALRLTIERRSFSHPMNTINPGLNLPYLLGFISRYFQIVNFDNW